MAGHIQKPMFNTIKMYIYAAIGVLISGALIMLKILTFQNKKLREENKGHEKREEIREDISADKKKIEEARDEGISDNDGSDYDNYI